MFSNVLLTSVESMFNVVFILVCCHRVKNNTCGEYMYMEAVGNDEHVMSFIQFSAFVIENIYFFCRGSLSELNFDEHFKT